MNNQQRGQGTESILPERPIMQIPSFGYKWYLFYVLACLVLSKLWHDYIDVWRICWNWCSSGRSWIRSVCRTCWYCSGWRSNDGSGTWWATSCSGQTLFMYKAVVSAFSIHLFLRVFFLFGRCWAISFFARFMVGLMKNKVNLQVLSLASLERNWWKWDLMDNQSDRSASCGWWLLKLLTHASESTVFPWSNFRCCWFIFSCHLVHLNISQLSQRFRCYESVYYD